MLAIDIVKPEPKTEYELEKRRQNRWASELSPLRSGVKKIEVKRVYNCWTCGVETTYFYPGRVCEPCETKSELNNG
jgi:hypothetical protein